MHGTMTPCLKQVQEDIQAGLSADHVCQHVSVCHMMTASMQPYHIRSVASHPADSSHWNEQAAVTNPGLNNLPPLPEDVGDAMDALSLAQSYMLESMSTKALPTLPSQRSMHQLASSSRSRPRTAPSARPKSSKVCMARSARLIVAH